MTKDINFFHGLAIARIVNSKSIFLNKIDRSVYSLDDEIYFYIKHSTKRMSPWIFTFLHNQVEKIVSFNNSNNKIYIVLVCNDDGICCLDFKEFNAVISYKNSLYPKWIKVSRKKGEKYFVVGSDGKLKNKIGNSDYPRKLFSK
jgi:hypothetical protein